jgi:hypothetical protein
MTAQVGERYKSARPKKACSKAGHPSENGAR